MKFELGKVYRWEDIQKYHPDGYAVIAEPKREYGELKECRLLNFCTYENEFDFVRTKYKGKYVEVLKITDDIPTLLFIG